MATSKSKALEKFWSGKSWNRVRQENTKIPSDLKSFARKQEKREGKGSVSQRHDK